VVLEKLNREFIFSKTILQKIARFRSSIYGWVMMPLRVLLFILHIRIILMWW